MHRLCFLNVLREAVAVAQLHQFHVVALLLQAARLPLELRVRLQLGHRKIEKRISLLDHLELEISDSRHHQGLRRNTFEQLEQENQPHL